VEVEWEVVVEEEVEWEVAVAVVREEAVVGEEEDDKRMRAEWRAP
jgi:hypothetical protein